MEGKSSPTSPLDEPNERKFTLLEESSPDEEKTSSSSSSSPSPMPRFKEIQSKIMKKTNRATRNLPRINCPEHLIFCVDVSSEMENSTFIADENAFSSFFEVVRRLVEIFVCTKHRIDARHRFALVFLTDVAVWINDFVDDPQSFMKPLDAMPQPIPCNTLQLNSLFDCILEKVSMPDIEQPEVTPPPFIVRTIFIYGRSQCVPDFLFDHESHKNLMDSDYFFTDVLYLHEIPSDKNKCVPILDCLSQLDTKGIGYIVNAFEDTKQAQEQMSRLLAHPLQRPLQNENNLTLI